MSEHARYGGSTAERTINCPGWRGMADRMPEGKSSTDADRGTMLHNAMEMIYNDPDITIKSIIGMEFAGLTLTQELYDDKIAPAIEAVETIFDKYNVNDLECEARVKISKDAWGTADMLARGLITLETNPGESAESETLEVGLCLDYKFGDGILVDAEDNTQGLFYSAGAMLGKNGFFEGIDMLIVGIVQPNKRGIPDYSLWVISPQLAIDFPALLATAIEKAEGDNPPFKAGKHCKFCPGDGFCPPTSGALIAASRIDLKAPELLKLVPTFYELKRIKDTVKGLEKFIHEQLELGSIVKDHKLIAKRAEQQYTDPGAALKVAKKSRKLKRSEFCDEKLKSPAQMRKLCKKKGLDFEAIFGPHVAKISSGTTVAAMDDKRPGIPGIEELSALLDLSAGS